jgi:chromosomal replication initiation ATPase DnaA
MRAVLGAFCSAGVSQETFEKQYAAKTGKALSQVMGVSASNVKFDSSKSSNKTAAAAAPEPEPEPEPEAVPEKAEKPKAPVVEKKLAPETKIDPEAAELAAKAAADFAQKQAKSGGAKPVFTTGEGGWGSV